MKSIIYIPIIFLIIIVQGCKTDRLHESLIAIAEDGKWIIYHKNPVLTPEPGNWDGGALGSTTTVIVNDTMHMYYEAWGVRSDNPSNPDEEYSSLQIGHATSIDGINWIKDQTSPVIPKGKSGEWDHMGTWDPFVIYEDGIYKMWYGGGIKNTCNWGYSESIDGINFTKKGQISDLGKVEDIHVVHDAKSGNYYLYYWDRAYEPNALFVAESINETDFDFGNAINIRIEGEEYPGMYKFTQVLQQKGKWYMFYSDFVRPGCSNATVRLAISEDGKYWKSVNKNLIEGMDGNIVRISNNLYAMYYGPDGYFDQKDCDIRLAVYKGKLEDLIKEKNY
jgi:predicted GH43/DUF377 family glycosyl hydrolase